MSVKTFFIEKKDLDGGLVHAPGTLLLKLSGQGAVKATMASLIECLKLTPDEVSSLYRFENPFVWFLVPTSARVRTRILGKSFGNDKDFKVDVCTLEDEKIRVTLHWVAPTINKSKIGEIFGAFAEEGSKIEPIKLGNSDKWAAWIKLRKQTELPHYIQLRYEDDPRTYKVLVTIPGRRQQCWHCGQDQHWSNQCPNRANPRRDQNPTEGAKEVGGKISYAMALKGEGEKKQSEIDQQLKKDGFTMVESSKGGGKKQIEAMGATPSGLPPPNSPENKSKQSKKIKTSGGASSAPTTPTKITRKRALSLSSSSEDLNEDPRVEEEKREEEQFKLELNFPDSPSVLVIDEGEDPNTHSNT